MKRHTPYDEIDPFDDPLDDVDGFDGFILDDEVDDAEESWYKGFVEDHVMCDWGVGDSEGFCTKDRYGCHYQGCEYASDN